MKRTFIAGALALAASCTESIPPVSGTSGTGGHGGALSSGTGGAGGAGGKTGMGGSAGEGPLPDPDAGEYTCNPGIACVTDTDCPPDPLLKCVWRCEPDYPDASVPDYHCVSHAMP